MLENPAAPHSRTVRELARDYVLACDAYKAAYRTTLHNEQAPVEQRVDDMLAAEDTCKTMCDAKRALDAAQKVAA